jgi:hypothetical protein
VPWADFRIGRGSYDPLFAFYLNSHVGDRFWARDLRGLYAARVAGTAPRPPRTLEQQSALIQNITVNKTVSGINPRVLAAATPLAQVDRQVLRLVPVNREQLDRERKAIEGLRLVAAQRRQRETQLLASGPAPRKPTDPVRTVKLDVPATPRPTGEGLAVKPPPAPITPNPAADTSHRADRDKQPAPPRKDMTAPSPPRKEVTPPPPPRKEVTPPKHEEKEKEQSKDKAKEKDKAKGKDK